MPFARILIHEIDELMKIPTFDTKTLLTVGFSCLGLLVVVAAFYYYGKPKTPPEVTDIGVQNKYTDVTDGEHQEVDVEKIDAYQKSGKRQPYELAWDDVELAENIDMGMPTTDQASSEVKRRHEVTSDEASSTVAKSAQGFYADLRTAPESERTVAPAAPRRSGGGGTSSSRTMTQKERDDKVRHDYELASEIAQKMYGVDAQGNPVSNTQESNTQQEQRITVPAGQSQRSSSSSISSLDDGWGGGLSSLGSDDFRSDGGGDRPFRCMFTRDEKIHNGQRVTLRTLEDIVIDGVFIPANAHISAICSVKDRLMVSVNSFESNGHIYSLNMDGYDNDGALGIYCPSSANSSATTTARNDALSVGQSVLGGRMGAIASGIVRTGVSIARSAGNGESSVTVPAGYTFYIMKSQKKY